MSKIFKLTLITAIGLSLVLVSLGTSNAFAQMKLSKKPVKPPPVQSELVLESSNIVTVGRGRGGVIKVFGNETSVQDQPIWSYEISHSAVAIGDVDNDPSTREIVCPNGAKITEGKGKNATSYGIVFLNAYKEGVAGCWKSSYNAGDDGWTRKESTAALYDIVIADVDGVGGNEVVVSTTEQILVFKYVPAVDNFHIIAEFNKSVLEELLNLPGSNQNLIPRCVTAGNVDSGSSDEIFLSASVSDGNGWIENEGFLFAFRYSQDEENLELLNYVPSGAEFSFKDLYAANVDSDSNLEICAPCFTKGSDDLYSAFIYVWDVLGDATMSSPDIIQTLSAQTTAPNQELAVGELGTAAGAELVFERMGASRELVVYNLEQGLISSYVLPDDTYFSVVNIGDFDSTHPGCEIIGTGRNGNGYLYHVVFGVSFNIIWEYTGTMPDESTYLWDAIVG